MDYSYNYQHEEGEYGSYEPQRHDLNTTYINNNQMNQINLSNNNALNPSLITNMTINNGYSPFQSNQLIEQQIPPRMAMNMNMNMNMMNSQHLMPQHGQIQNMNIQNHINIHIQPYGHNHHQTQFYHNNYNQNSNRNRGRYNHNNRRRGQRHNHHQQQFNDNNNNANNPRGFQPKDAEFPWHLPPRLQRARAQKKLKKKMKQQRKQMQRQNTYYQHGPLYLYDASIPPPPTRQPPNPPNNTNNSINDYGDCDYRHNYGRDEEQYPPLPDIKSIPNDEQKIPLRSTRKRRRKGRQGNNNKKEVIDVIDNDGQKKNNIIQTQTQQTQSQQTQRIDIGDNGNNGNNGNDGDYAFMHQFVNTINNDNDNHNGNGNGDDTVNIASLDPIIDLNLNDNHFKSMEQEIVDNVFLLQQDHDVHEQSFITNDNVSQYSSTTTTTTTYGANNNVSVTIGELFGDISCSSSYTKSNTNSPNPKKNKLYHNNNDIVSLSKIEW